MNDEWAEVRKILGEHTFTLGSVYSNQILNSPRQFLFALSRYKFAAKMLSQTKRLNVLELGCGEGIGTIMLSEKGHYITAVDYDIYSIEYAKKNVNIPNISFLCQDFLGKEYGKFDAIVCLDVIEHISSDNEDIFFNTALKNLKKEGFMIIGTPNETAKQYASNLSKIGHINLYNADRLTEIIEKYFQNVFLFGMNDEVLHTGFYPMCHYLMAIGCNRFEPFV